MSLQSCFVIFANFEMQLILFSEPGCYEFRLLSEHQPNLVLLHKWKLPARNQMAGQTIGNSLSLLYIKIFLYKLLQAMGDLISSLRASLLCYDQHHMCSPLLAGGSEA